MSNYTLAVSWSGKDALADSDASKVISGADFNTEFTAVQTAVNTKAELAGSASQAFAAVTASAGTNTTQVATTAFVKTANDAQTQVTAAIINALVYPVGSIYFNMEVATNPATLLGMGTWVAYGEGRVLVGKAASGTFDTLNEELGSETDSHALSIAELPSHTHTLLGGGFDGSSGAEPGSTRSSNLGQSGSTGSGSAHTHDILQPSVTVYMWKRTA